MGMNMNRLLFFLFWGSGQSMGHTQAHSKKLVKQHPQRRSGRMQWRVGKLCQWALDGVHPKARACISGPGLRKCLFFQNEGHGRGCYIPRLKAPPLNPEGVFAVHIGQFRDPCRVWRIGESCGGTRWVIQLPSFLHCRLAVKKHIWKRVLQGLLMYKYVLYNTVIIRFILNQLEPTIWKHLLAQRFNTSKVHWSCTSFSANRLVRDLERAQIGKGAAAFAFDARVGLTCLQSQTNPIADLRFGPSLAPLFRVTGGAVLAGPVWCSGRARSSLLLD